MTTTDTTVNNLIINTMTQAQYSQITPDPNQLYIVTDSTITSSEITSALGYTPQQQLVSGTNIKTINNESILGSGNISVSGGGGGSSTLANLSDVTISNPSNKQVLCYDGNNWTNQNCYINLQNIVTLSSGTITLTDTNSIYKIIPSANTTFTFTNNTSASSSVAYTFELYIDMQTNYTMTFPNNVVWQDNTAPDLSGTGKFLLAFRTMDGGSSWIGNLQGVW